MDSLPRERNEKERLRFLDRQSTTTLPLAVQLTQTSTQRHPWWIWPNLLSLDAPFVTLVWVLAIGSASGLGSLPWHLPVLLTLAVWCIYIGDRLWDVRRMVKLNEATARHQFHARHFRVLSGLLALAMVTGLVLAVWKLSLGVWLTAAAVTLVVGGYYWQLQRGIIIIPKEVACGVIIGLGTLTPLSGHWDAVMVAHAALFGALCTANCLAIARWEREQDASNDLNATPQRHPAVVRLLPWMLGGIGLCGLLLGTHLGLAASLASLALGALLLFEHTMSLDLLRVLSDVCLLTPLLLLLERFWS